MRYRLLIEYHGGGFVGWQRQASGLSIQGVLEDALRHLGAAGVAAGAEDEASRPAPLVQGAGRTDAGVHATGQVAHVDLAREWDPFRLAAAINHHLRPHAVSVLEAVRVAPDFHARFSAQRRHYLYRIINRHAPLTLEAGQAWRVARPLDAEAMAEAAALLTGHHDFTTFRSTQCQAASPVKTLDVFEVVRDGETILCRLEARSFLHNQVRSLVGTLERVGSGAWKPAEVQAALKARSRAACGPVAPPDGLVLTRVDYPDDGPDDGPDHDPESGSDDG
ncbi:MAG: tRNA pseudouridine(38-40) synthase TruA [Pseudomonadota bacterium]